MKALFIAAVQDLIIGGGAETQDNDAQGARKPDESWQPMDAQAIQSMNINKKTDLNVKVLCDCNYEIESEEKTLDSFRFLIMKADDLNIWRQETEIWVRREMGLILEDTNSV